MALSPGTRVGPYEIQSLVGRGSMGEVYRAADPRLGRTVAIKYVTRDRAERFATEARAIAALNHPHICQIYDVGPDYLVLEFLEGEQLSGPVAAAEALRLALQMADALSAAHAAGVLHRDLKPANVMVVGPDGSRAIKLLDFGVARLTNLDTDATRTSAGAVLGTPAYMSPEQAQGRPLDARSDIFSFGAVIYELLSGRRPFVGESVAEMLSAVLRDDPPALDAPPSLVHVVMRCLAKDPAARFASIPDVRRALQAVTLNGHDARASIVVLPFANLSADKENEYFGDGLAEEIINALAQVSDLKVIARTSAFAFKGKHEDVRVIAQTLGVTNVLEGSVRRSGDRIRVTAQLIAATDGAHLWSERYDRPMTDVFAMQDEIAQAITTELRGKLVRRTDTPARYTPKVAAYDALLKGRTHLMQFTPEAWGRVMTLFKRSIELDTLYPEPHIELALGHFISGMHGMRPMAEVAPLVKAEAQRALTLDPLDPRPRFLCGAIALAFDYDWKAAASHFAVSMTATDISPHARWIYAGLYLRGLGRFDESAAEMARVVEHDPLNAMWQSLLGAHLLDAGRVDEALEAARTGVALDVNHFVALNILGNILWVSGDREAAFEMFDRAHRLAPWDPMGTGWYAAGLWHRGQKDEARQLIRAITPSSSHLWGRVIFHLEAGELEEAADWYERMIAARDPFALVYARAAVTKSLREHPRWRGLAELMHLPPAGTVDI